MEKQQQVTPSAPSSQSTKPASRSRFVRVPKTKQTKRIELGHCCTKGSGGGVKGFCDGSKDACAVCFNCVYDPPHKDARERVAARLAQSGMTVIKWVSHTVHENGQCTSRGHVIVEVEE